MLRRMTRLTTVTAWALAVWGCAEQNGDKAQPDAASSKLGRDSGAIESAEQDAGAATSEGAGTGSSSGATGDSSGATGDSADATGDSADATGDSADATGGSCHEQTGMCGADTSADTLGTTGGDDGANPDTGGNDTEWSTATGSDASSSGATSENDSEPSASGGGSSVTDAATGTDSSITGDSGSPDGGPDGGLTSSDVDGGAWSLDAGSSGGFGCDAFLGGEQCESCVVYVATNGDDGNTGESWQAPKATVQAAIDAAAERVGLGVAPRCSLWITKGRYLPVGEGRDATIQLRPKVDLFGGFEGFEQMLSERDENTLDTLLSGDLAGDDEPGNVTDHRGDNVYHVITGADDAMLERLTISGGHADGANGSLAYGGGLLARDSLLQVERCRFLHNYARGGGGLMLEGGTVSISRSEILENSATTGGGLYADSVGLHVDTTLFSKNQARFSGGAVVVYGGSRHPGAHFSASQFVDNAGLGAVTANGPTHLSNCVLSDNHSTALEVNDETYLNNCVIANNGGSAISVLAAVVDARNVTIAFNDGCELPPIRWTTSLCCLS